MTGRACVFVALAALLLACGSRSRGKRDSFSRPEQTRDDSSTRRGLVRDLEATVLENYNQLTLGNLEAYSDGISRDLDLVLIGLAHGDLVVGVDQPGIKRDRRPYEGQGMRLLSKNLSVHLSRDESVGWIFDEVSLRVPYREHADGVVVMEREASIPLRVTAAFVRDVDRWVLVMEHVSYPLPAADILDWARSKELGRPAPLKPERGEDIRKVTPRTAKAIGGVVVKLHTQTGDARRNSLGSDERELLLWPDPDAEFHGAEVLDSLRLADMFPEIATVKVEDYRVSARIGQVSWMVATLAVTVGEGSDQVVVRMRGSYVLEARKVDEAWRWEIVQAHVSVPIDRAQLTRRVFGSPLGDE